MLFSTPEFILCFLPAVWLGYFALTRMRLPRAGKIFLVLASLFFYGWWDVRYLPLLCGSIAFNFVAGMWLGAGMAGESGMAGVAGKSRRFAAAGASDESQVAEAAGAAASKGRLNGRRRRWLLAFAVAANLALLGWYKYANFFFDNVGAVTGLHLTLREIVLPLGISFFTFTQIAFLVDSFQGKAREYDLVHYALFVTFFPHLIAGPILHHAEMMSQFESRWTLLPRQRHLLWGLVLFGLGLFKKIVIADTFAIWANAGFDGAGPMDFWGAWAAALSYTFQLYFDFSGYSDMAVGAALLFNIWLPLNFDSPYKALSIQDFWRRWHITLGRYLRDYVYVPLGGNRVSTLRTHGNLFVTFLVGGLWHGASWMFVAWGALHGAALVAHRVWRDAGLRMPRPLAWLCTFGFVVVAWVFFRASNWDGARRVLGGMVNLRSAMESASTQVAQGLIHAEDLAWSGPLGDRLLATLPAGFAANFLPLMASAFAFALIALPNSMHWMRHSAHSDRFVAASAVLTLAALYVAMSSTSQLFLYFNF